MQTYTFRSFSSRVVTVKADDEEQARVKAMRALWGPPADISARIGYRGIGLQRVID